MLEKTISKKIAFQGKLLTLEQLDVQLEDGRAAYREIVRHPGAVGVLGRLPGNRFVLVRQYRKPVEAHLVEVVAGLLDPDEKPEEAAHRELEEETGYRAHALIYLGTVYASPGYVDEKIEVYLAELEDRPAKKMHLDHGEHVEVLILDRETLVEEIAGGRIRDSKTLATWALFLERERRHMQRSHQA